jgi:hypothetical protein
MLKKIVALVACVFVFEACASIPKNQSVTHMMRDNYQSKTNGFSESRRMHRTGATREAMLMDSKGFQR